MANIDSVKIRMYRHGFGDCFLLRFFRDEKVVFKMLIDCGLKHNDSVEGVSIADVVKDIGKEVMIKKAGKNVPHLDVLVVTHEHWDHVSAFKPEKKLFDGFDIDRIWMAWTENPKDKVAQQINAHLKQNVTALSIAAKRLSKSTSDKKKAGFFDPGFLGVQKLAVRESFDKALGSVLDFYGPLGVTTTTASGIKIKDNFSISIETQKAFDHIKTKLAKNKSAIKYFNPGTLVDKEELVPGIRVYVMGPPKNAQLNKDAPSKGEAKEVYLGLNDSGMMGFVKGILKQAGARMGFDDGSPFTAGKLVPESEAKTKAFYKHAYYHRNEAWRNIDEDWLNMAGALAMQMDNDTNNTSLVLAIELIDSGKILLFPGDAQVGNWESWHDYEWTVREANKKTTVTATDLLNRTVFYKAGHHASHNATLKDKGLELMEDEALTVFIPEKEDQYNGIPYSDLVERLKEKAKGRVLFSADSNFPPEKALQKKPDGITKKDWDLFKKNIKITPMYIEYAVS